MESVLRTFSSDGESSTVDQKTVLRLRNYDLCVKTVQDKSDSQLKGLNEVEVKHFAELKLLTTIKVESSRDNSKTALIGTRFDERLEPTIVSRIINSWHIFKGIAIGLIIIIIAILIFIRLGIFNKVRIYREDIEQIHSRNNSILRGSVESRNIFIDHVRQSMAEQDVSKNNEKHEIELKGLENKGFKVNDKQDLGSEYEN